MGLVPDARLGVRALFGRRALYLLPPSELPGHTRGGHVSRWQWSMPAAIRSDAPRTLDGSHGARTRLGNGRPDIARFGELRHHACHLLLGLVGLEIEKADETGGDGQLVVHIILRQARERTDGRLAPRRHIGLLDKLLLWASWR